jgi:nucleotide-binding universal stress UspA family protein
MLSQVLVTLDGSQLSERALNYARQVVDTTGEITLLTVVDVPDYPIYTVYPMPLPAPEPDYSTIVTDMLTIAREYVDGIANSLRLAGYRVKTVVKSGDPATNIIEVAQERKVDAIVISTHGRSGLSKWLFGSVTQKVLSVMPCPVIVVPGNTQPVEKTTDEVDTVKA